MTITKEDFKEAIGEFNSRRLSVSDALRAEPGTSYKVYGMISSLSAVYRMVTGQKVICPKCGYGEEEKYEMAMPQPKTLRARECPECETEMRGGNYTYVPTINVDLMDTDSFSEIERLPVAFFADATRNVNIGERVSIRGKLHVTQNRGKGKLFQIIYADSVEYEGRDELELTPSDVQAIERFVKMKGDGKIIKALVKMHSPEIFGHDSIKEGLLMSEVNAGPDIGNKPRKRIHVILVGPPGIAKTLLLQAAVKHVPRSRYESGQHSTGKSLTAIIEKEQEMHILRLGPAPLAREAILAVNELGRMQEDDQGQLLDLMEEGTFSSNKHGINARIRADTTMLASANPRNTTWKGNEGGDSKIDLDEIPALKVLLDRFDLIFIMKSVVDENEIRRYAEMKAQMDERNIANYNEFMRKYLQYAKSINPVIKVSEEAKSILNEAYVKIAVRGIGTPRIRDTLYRLAKARARLKLKPIVDIRDAQETIEFYNSVIYQSADLISMPEAPNDVAYKIMLELLRKSSGVPLGLAYLVEEASKQSPQVKSYLGGRGYDIGSNNKLRRIVDQLVDHSRVKQVQNKPIVLQWLKEEGSQQAADQNEQNNHQEDRQNLSDTSDTSVAENSSVVTSSNPTENAMEYPVIESSDYHNTAKTATDISDISDRLEVNYTFLYQIECPGTLPAIEPIETDNYYYFSYISGSARRHKTPPSSNVELDAIYRELKAQGCQQEIYRPVYHNQYRDILPDEWLPSLSFIRCWECGKHDADRLYTAAKLAEHLKRKHSLKFEPNKNGHNTKRFNVVTRKDIILNQIASPDELERALCTKTRFECPDRECHEKRLIFSSPSSLMRHVKTHNNEWTRQTLAWLEVLGLTGNEELVVALPFRGVDHRVVDDGGNRKLEEFGN